MGSEVPCVLITETKEPNVIASLISNSSIVRVLQAEMITLL